MSDFNAMQHRDDIRVNVVLKPILELRKSTTDGAMFDRVLDEIHKIPWDRIVDFFGRATVYPIALMNLTAEESPAVERALLDLSGAEHQQTITQVTPLVSHFILKLYPLIAPHNRRHVDKFMHRLARALETAPDTINDQLDISFIIRKITFGLNLSTRRRMNTRWKHERYRTMNTLLGTA